MRNLQILNQLKPEDPYKKTLPPSYQAGLDEQYQNFLGRALSQSRVLKGGENNSVPANNRSRTSLTNPEHKVMQVNHRFLASKISELPHHYFRVENTTPDAKRPSYVSTQLPTKQNTTPRKILARERRSSSKKYLRSSSNSQISSAGSKRSQ